jgi:hypothetical protein
MLEELKVEPVYKKIRYKSNWLRHVTRNNNNRMPQEYEYCLIIDQMDEDYMEDL